MHPVLIGLLGALVFNTFIHSISFKPPPKRNTLAEVNHMEGVLNQMEQLMDLDNFFNSTDPLKRSMGPKPILRSLGAVAAIGGLAFAVGRYANLSAENGLTGVSEYLVNLVEKSMDDVPPIPRLDVQDCIKRAICEAHHQPKKYGLVGMLLQLLFPPYAKTEDSKSAVFKYQLAARYGRKEEANCAVQYDGCMVSVLDITRSLMNSFVSPNSGVPASTSSTSSQRRSFPAPPKHTPPHLFYPQPVAYPWSS
ncbi:hypothetical protein LAZ67_11003195 [Cordylochernes scorpioides]|uniref:Uncharacterized protein n=1 Tax=Cordylochernes scorpioides TaxID=51811 RepID=A0ABY6KZN5_9ARAC|nr:hypothetical protein LAZ67_11003195 [Cordylochernes scorpioides]